MSNQTSRTEFVLSSEGKIIQRLITESQKELTNEHLDQLTANRVLFSPKVFRHEILGFVDLGLSKTNLTMTAPLEKIRIKANYIVYNGVLVPAFDHPKEPVFDIDWTLPADMTVKFVVELSGKNQFQAAHMVVLDTEKRCYRLPLGNIYETGMICLGKAESPYSGSAQDIFRAVFTQFHNSQWNNDLQLPSDTAIILQLFRFKPKGDGFEQLDATVKWQDYCSVIAPPILNFIQV